MLFIAPSGEFQCVPLLSLVPRSFKLLAGTKEVKKGLFNLLAGTLIMRTARSAVKLSTHGCRIVFQFSGTEMQQDEFPVRTPRRVATVLVCITIVLLYLGIVHSQLFLSMQDYTGVTDSFWWTVQVGLQRKKAQVGQLDR